MICRPVALLACVVALAGAAGPAMADATKARAHYERATSLYQVGEYQQALDEFKLAHVEKPDVAFLYNIAQCFRQLGDRSNALVFYKRFLSLAPDSPLRPEVEKRIGEMESPVPRDSAPPSHSMLRMESPAQTPPTGAVTASLDSTPKPEAARALPLPRWLPLASAAVTVALATGAIVTGLSANNQYDSLAGSCGQTAAGCTSAQIGGVTSREHLTNALWVLTGLAAAGTGVTAYVNAREGGVAALWRF